MSNQLSVKNNFAQAIQTINKECDNYRTNSQIVKKNETKLTNFIKDNTKKEVEEVNESIKKLNLKVEKLMEIPQVKQVQNQLEQSSKEMFLSLQKVMDCFNKGKRCILERNDIPQEKKNQCMKLMYEKLMNKLYTKEEMEKFQHFFNRVSIIPSSPKMLM
jgi:hypothetical protein